MKLSEACDAFQRIGLSRYEALVFVNLARAGATTAGDLARASGVNRVQTYRALEDLEARGLVEVTLDRPRRYAARAITFLIQDERTIRGEGEPNGSRSSGVVDLISISGNDTGFGKTVMDPVTPCGVRRRRMRASRIVGAILLVTVMVGLSLGASLAKAEGDNQENNDEHAAQWVAVLFGQFEVPPRTTPAHGVAEFSMNDDGTIAYELFVEDISNVIMAHIHMAPAGVNGPVVVWLFPVGGPPPAAPGGGPFEGELATGTITASNLVGPLMGHPLSDLVAILNNGNAYVNVHTDDGVAPANTGPGDFPGGEIRGQVRVEDENQD